MRETLTALLVLVYAFAFAQPANDDCETAIELTLSDPGACPDGEPASDLFSYDNNGATPISPYPSFVGCEGGANDAPAAEVWFTFESSVKVMSFDITGALNTPNAVLYQGEECGFLSPVSCGRGAPGSGTLSFFADVRPGRRYYLMISGESLTDQGAFELDVRSFPDCDGCQNNNELIVSPPPVNGTYSVGQEVQFCYTVNQWDIQDQEWLHAVVVDFGPGWDVSTVQPEPPESCDGLGEWAWYDSWESNTTGQLYGPGFAYDSQSGAPNDAQDGNPGNNWGDGENGCDNIGVTAEPRTFCFRVRVADCTPNPLNNDLSVTMTVFSDGESGSWFQTGCNNGTEEVFLAIANCCNDFDPAINQLNETTCREFCDGSITFVGSGGVSPGPWDYTVFDAANNIVFEAPGESGAVTVDGLCAGQYSVLAVNILTNCFRSSIVDVPNGDPPDATATNTGPYCRWAAIELQGSTSWTGTDISYDWSGPNGYTSTAQNPADATEAGEYRLVITVDGCISDTAFTTVEFTEDNLVAPPLPPVCPGTDTVIVLSDFVTGTLPNGGWSEISPVPSQGGGFDAGAGTFNPAGQAPGVYSFAYLPQSGEPCDSEPALVDITVAAGPVADAGEDQLLTCDQTTVTLGGDSTSVGNGFTYAWTFLGAGDNLFNASVATTEVQQPGDYQLEVTDADGCTAIDIVLVDVDTDRPTLTTEARDISCFGANDGLIAITELINGDPPYELRINGMGVSPQRREFDQLEPGIYEIEATDSKGCAVTNTVEVVEPPLLVVGITTNQEDTLANPSAPIQTVRQKLGDSTRLTALYPADIQLASIVWQPTGVLPGDSINSIWVSPFITTTYEVTITNENGCTASDAVEIMVDRSVPLYMPNAFSPNDDGANDEFYPFAGQQVQVVKSFRVFNRWGEPVHLIDEDFAPNDRRFGWDGTYRGKEVDSGVYVYHVVIELVDGTEVEESGDVVLLR